MVTTTDTLQVELVPIVVAVRVAAGCRPRTPFFVQRCLGSVNVGHQRDKLLHVGLACWA